MKAIVRIFALFVVMMVTSAVDARAAGTPDSTAAPRPAVDIYFMTFYPGGEVYELEGHTAIGVVHRADRKVPPLAYNYGVFDFEAPGFVWRFATGRTDYMLAPAPLDLFVDYYRAEGRRVVAHRLALDSAEAEALARALAIESLPQNRTYRYNYVLDNCATRPLAAVERVVGDSICLGPAPYEAQSLGPLTFRNVMRSYHANYPWYQFGIDLALGSLIDRPVESRAAAFAPAELDRMLGSATVGAGGRPLVAETIVLNDVAPAAAVRAPTPWYLTPMAAGCVLLALALVLTVRDVCRRRVCRSFDTVLFGVYGLAGCMLTFLMFVSEHYATSPNWLYIWLNPICGVAAVLLWIKSAKKVVFWYQICNFAALTGFLIAMPWIPQGMNAAFVPFILAEMTRSASYIYITNRNRK